MMIPNLGNNLNAIHLRVSRCGPRSSDELRRSQASGQTTPSGRTTAEQTGGETRFGGSGQIFSSGLFCSSPTSASSLFSSPDDLMRLVLISKVGRSTGETSDFRWKLVLKNQSGWIKNYKQSLKTLQNKRKLQSLTSWKCERIQTHAVPACLRQDQCCLWAALTHWRDSSVLEESNKLQHLSKTLRNRHVWTLKTFTFCRDQWDSWAEEEDLQVESELSDTQTVPGKSGCILPEEFKIRWYDLKYLCLFVYPPGRKKTDSRFFMLYVWEMIWPPEQHTVSLLPSSSADKSSGQRCQEWHTFPPKDGEGLTMFCVNKKRRTVIKSECFMKQQVNQ